MSAQGRQSLLEFPFLGPVFSKGDAQLTGLGDNLRPGTDAQRQIIYYQVNYQLNVLL